jgi:hypothetical protein
MLFSCKGKPVKTDPDYFSNLEFSVDTVIIDPGDEIIFLKHQLLNADMGKDGKYFLNFNNDDHTLEKINLDKLRLEEKVPFDTEGPNGTGPGIGMMKVHSDSQITMNNLSHTSLFSLEGEKVRTIYFENFSLGLYSMEDREYLKPERVLDKDENQLYGLIYRFQEKSFALCILDLETFEVERLELKSFENLSKFQIYYTPGNSRIAHQLDVDLKKIENKVIISNEITNILMWYDTVRDSLFTKSYASQLTANQKEKEYVTEYETLEEFEIAKRKLRQEINFMPPFWEEQGECFYRFSHQEIENTGGERTRSKVYLTALDKDLNLLGETLIPHLTKKPGKHFAKDGEIWIYENINDEMGFVRLKMEKK